MCLAVLRFSEMVLDLIYLPIDECLLLQQSGPVAAVFGLECFEFLVGFFVVGEIDEVYEGVDGAETDIAELGFGDHFDMVGKRGVEGLFFVDYAEFMLFGVHFRVGVVRRTATWVCVQGRGYRLINEIMGQHVLFYMFYRYESVTKRWSVGFTAFDLGCCLVGVVTYTLRLHFSWTL